jgi:hypothetical protein
MWFQFKVDKGEPDAVPWGGGEVPYTVLTTGVEVRPIWTADFTLRVLDFVLATSCLKILSMLCMKNDLYKDK